MSIFCICIIKKNNVKYISLTGNGEYPLFGSADEAARHFVEDNNRLTHTDNKERGTYIYKININKALYYFYPKSKPGKHNHVIKNVVTNYCIGIAFTSVKNALNPERLKSGAVTPVAFVHTHPSCVCHIGEDFSKEDKMMIKIPFVKIMYLGTPHGFLYGYDKFCAKRLVSADMPAAPSVAQNSNVLNS